MAPSSELARASSAEAGAPASGPARFDQALVALARAGTGEGQRFADACRTITELAASTVGVERVGVWGFSLDRERLLCLHLYESTPRRHARGPELVAREFPRYFEALERERVVAAEDALGDPRTAEYSASYLRPNGIASMLDAPVHVEGQLVAIVCFEQVGAKRRWSEQETSFAAAIASLVGLAWEVERRRRAQQELEEAYAELAREMTDRWQAEQEVRESNAHLERAQRMEAMGRVAGGVAHDFNNFLTVVLGYTALLREGLPAGDPNRECAEQIQRAAERAMSLTQQLLAFSRRQVLRPERLDLLAATQALLPMLRSTCGEAITVDLLHDSRPCWIEADSAQIAQVLFNLVLNARDALPTGGRVELALVARPGDATATTAILRGAHVELSIRDNGIGMDEATQSRLFEPFFTTKEKGRSTGLGLSSVYGIVRQSGGTIEVESRLGEGTRFRVLLPSVEAVPASNSALAARRPEGKRVLLVEDDAEVRALVTEMLLRVGYDVVAEAEGKSALAAAGPRAAGFDVAVVDQVLPGMSGGALIQELRRANPKLPVLLISGHIEGPGASVALPPNARLLSKPFSPLKLLDAVRESIG